MRRIDFDKFVNYCQRNAEIYKNQEQTAWENKDVERMIRANEAADIYQYLYEAALETEEDCLAGFVEVFGEESEVKSCETCSTREECQIRKEWVLRFCSEWQGKNSGEFMEDVG